MSCKITNGSSARDAIGTVLVDCRFSAVIHLESRARLLLEVDLCLVPNSADSSALDPSLVDAARQKSPPMKIN